MRSSYCASMPANRAFIEIGEAALSWRQLKGWINSNAHDLLEFAKVGYGEKGRGLVILAGSPLIDELELTIKCRYIMPEEIADIDNEALDLAHQLVGKYDPEYEFVVVTIDSTSHVTSALVAVEPISSEIVH